MKPRAVFFGTPQFAVPSLNALSELATITAVVCQPDKPKGRGLEVEAPPVKNRAQELGIQVVQPTKLRTGEFGEWLRTQNVDVAVVVAYGRILPEDVLAAPRLGCVNVHASLLPKYRGAAPLAWSILKGETVTGVSIMQLDIGMDTGPVFVTTSLSIEPDETTGELSSRLAELGAGELRVHLPRILGGELKATAQDESGASLAPILKKTDGQVDFTRCAHELHCHVRGMAPWPGAYAFLGGKRIAFHRVAEVAGKAEPGLVALADKSRVLVGTGDGLLSLLIVQPEGKKPMSIADWFAGRGVQSGARFDPPRAP